MENANKQKRQFDPGQHVRFEPATTFGMTCEKAAEFVQKRENLNYMLMMFLAMHLLDNDAAHDPACPAHDKALVEEVRKQAADGLEDHAERRGWDGL